MGRNDRLGYVWLVTGTVVSLFAMHGRWDAPVAAWLYCLFFLRFTRTRGALAGLAGVWTASAIGVTFWIYESGLEVFSPILLLCLGLSSVLTLPFLVDRLVAPRLTFTSGVLAALVFPLARAAAEYLVAVISPAGNIMGSLAATQHDNLPLLQTAAVTGAYGISFLMAWFASVGNWIWEHGLSWPRIRAVALIFGVVLAVAVVGGNIRLAFFPPAAATVRVAGISPDRSLLAARNALVDSYPSPEQMAHADPGPLRHAFATVNDNLLATSEREARAGAKIITWPEVGAATIAQDRDDLIARVAALTRSTGAYLAIGLGVVTKQPPYLQNQAILVDPRGRVAWTYDKAHPVPGLEVFTPGDGRVPTADTPYGRLANVICFDADFPDLMRQAGSSGVDLMLVPSNDWREFGVVHAQKATIRAVENGYSLVRPDTHGLARTVDYQGRVLASSDYFTTDQQIMVAYVPTKGTRTIYAMVGDLFVRLCLAGLVLLTVAAAYRTIRSRPAAPEPAAGLRQPDRSPAATS